MCVCIESQGNHIAIEHEAQGCYGFPRDSVHE